MCWCLSFSESLSRDDFCSPPRNCTDNCVAERVTPRKISKLTLRGGYIVFPGVFKGANRTEMVKGMSVKLVVIGESAVLLVTSHTQNCSDSWIFTSCDLSACLFFLVNVCAQGSPCLFNIVLVYMPPWPQTLSLPVSALQVLGLQVWNSMRQYWGRGLNYRYRGSWVCLTGNI